MNWVFSCLRGREVSNFFSSSDGPILQLTCEHRNAFWVESQAKCATMGMSNFFPLHSALGLRIGGFVFLIAPADHTDYQQQKCKHGPSFQNNNP